MLTTSCHCGAIQIAVFEKPARLTRCTCSVCRRYGALWGHLTRRTTVVNYEPGAAKAYSWNDHVIEFYHCTNCGCLTHYESVDKNPDDRISINFRMFPPEVVRNLEIKTFDGADTWEYLDD